MKICWKKQYDYLTPYFAYLRCVNFNALAILVNRVKFATP